MKIIDTMKKSESTKIETDQTEYFLQNMPDNTQDKLKKGKFFHSLIYVISIVAVAAGIILNYLHLCEFTVMWAILISSGLLIFISEQVYISHFKPLHYRADNTLDHNGK